MALSEKYSEGIWAARRDRLKRWTGHDILSAPIAIDTAPHLVAIVASHQSKHPEWSATWRHRLFTSLTDCREKNMTVLYSLENPIGNWILEFAKRLEVRSIRVLLPNNKINSSDLSHKKALQLEQLTQFFDSDVSPNVRGLPLVDRVLFALADSVHALSIRPGSKTDRLAKAWLAEHVFDGNSGRLVSYDDDTVMQALLPENQATVFDRDIGQLAGGNTGFGSLIIPRRMLIGSHFNTSKFLVHCTRGRSGRLPFQSNAAYAVEMFGNGSDIATTPLENLKRILSDRRLIATSYLKRNDVASVSLSSVPLLELLSRRQYRSHLQRWDWEPYGIGFRKSVLEDRFSAKEVIYDTDQESVGDSKQSPSNLASGKARWAEEKEWRVPNDIRLLTLEYSDAFVFVPSMAEAMAIAPSTPFPIAVVAE